MITTPFYRGETVQLGRATFDSIQVYFYRLYFQHQLIPTCLLLPNDEYHALVLPREATNVSLYDITNLASGTSVAISSLATLEPGTILALFSETNAVSQETLHGFRRIAQAVGWDDMTYASECNGDTCCIFCGGTLFASTGVPDALYLDFKHDPDCLTVRARKLVPPAIEQMMQQQPIPPTRERLRQTLEQANKEQELMSALLRDCIRCFASHDIYDQEVWDLRRRTIKLLGSGE